VWGYYGTLDLSWEIACRRSDKGRIIPIAGLNKFILGVKDEFNKPWFGANRSISVFVETGIN
jgi:hypothetical protein